MPCFRYKKTDTHDPDDRSTQQEDDKTRRTYVRVTVLFISLNLLLIALNILAVVYVIKERQVKVEHAPSNLCVLCEHVRLHPEDKLEHITRSDDGTVCCANKPEHIGSLVAYYTEHWMKMKTAKENKPYTYCCNDTQQRKPAIKLIGLLTRQYSSDTDEHRKLMWDSPADITNNVTNNVTFIATHGQVKIEVTGLYYVYSQLLFDHNNVNNTYHGHPVIFNHKVVLIKAGNLGPYHDPVMMGSQTPCASDLDIQRTTSYIGGVFQLQKGDQLYVTVPKKEDVAPIPHMNVFGVHMIGNDYEVNPGVPTYDMNS